MKQLTQNLGSGAMELLEVPDLSVRESLLLIESRMSLVSAGTERMLTDFSRANLIGKVRQQPEKVREVLRKARSDGALATLAAVRSKLEVPIPLGYCNVGTVVGVGSGVRGVEVGQRIASNGPHAEQILVPPTLSAKIPDEVSDEQAVFTVVGAIALQGLRLAKPTLGERFVVTGLGLVGLLTVQLLQANGCRVLGVDSDPDRIRIAQAFGAETVNLAAGEDPVEMARLYSRGRGVDGVILTLSSNSDEPIKQAAHMCRKRGRIVLVGVTGLALDRQDFYEKELTFQVSSSYGPGRYDPTYEEQGRDYPLAFVRWTAQRNFEAVLDMLASGALNVGPLITHKYPFDRAPEAYDLLSNKTEPSLGIVLTYPQRKDRTTPTVRLSAVREASLQALPKPRLSVIGAGNYASRVLIPALARTPVHLRRIASERGMTASLVGKKHGFEEATTDVRALIADTDTDALVIATRHDTHAALALAGLDAGKSVFVEKPLVITREELQSIRLYFDQATDAPSDGSSPHGTILMVGFNRRFAPLIATSKRLLDSVAAPKSLVYTVNAGQIPQSHWTQDPVVGGGRIIGEAVHFVDLARYLVGHPIVVANVVSTADGYGGQGGDDVATLSLSFQDGSIASIHYFANGPSELPKERIEVFAGGKHLLLNNYRSLTGRGWKGFIGERSWRQDKGQDACIRAFIDALRNGSGSPIPLEELLEVHDVTLQLAEAAR